MISPRIKRSLFVLPSVTLYIARSFNASAIVLGAVHVAVLPLGAVSVVVCPSESGKLEGRKGRQFAVCTERKKKEEKKEEKKEKKKKEKGEGTEEKEGAEERGKNRVEEKK
jgi:hypothetical protein